MAVAIDTMRDVLADTDEATAALILRLQIEDADTNTSSDPVPYTRDFLCAKAQWSRDLKLFQSRRRPNALLEQPALLSPPTPAPVVLFDCNGACGEQFTANGCWRTPCGHYYCDGCLNNLFGLAMGDKTAYPPRCCRQAIDFDDVRHLLDQQLAEDFATKKPELDDPTPTYCYIATCSAYIRESNKNEQVATCPQCEAKTCILCKDAQHEGDCADDKAIEDTKKLAAKEGWKQCPRCESIVELTHGCNHMTCRCKAQFCYVCTKLWKNCPCPQFEERRLLARANEVANRNGGGNVDAIAARLRQQHECRDNNHDYEWTHGENRCEQCNQLMPTFIFRCRGCQIQHCRNCRFHRT